MKLLYQPHIDGLRALAVLAVIIYHLEIKFFSFTFLPGGFLGVDIFFVISGYLISLIILQELKIRKGKFSFLNFYQRRARRILPALFTVMLFTTLFTFYFLIPNFLVDNSKSIVFSLFFLSK
jgi:peptidoglycan/LPS O-acetylase OafA/YrhL